MKKLRNSGIALALALMLCLTMLSSGAFAQSIAHTAGVTHHQECNGYWHPGYWQPGFWQNGYWQPGFWQDGYWHPGYWNSGYWHPGYWHNGWCEWQGMGSMGR